MRFEEALLLAGKGQLITRPGYGVSFAAIREGQAVYGHFIGETGFTAAMCRMGKTVRAGVPRCPRFPLANRESGTIGNLDALSFLNGATVGYDESRVPAGTSGGREALEEARWARRM